jgi:PadR family transcriptional regulator PadR
MEVNKTTTPKSSTIPVKGLLSSWVLEMCLLSLLSRNDNYGYELSRIIRFDVSESTLYPVLRRLEASDYLCSQKDINVKNGKLRKIYSITPHGIQHLKTLNNEWKSFVEKVDYLLEICD